MNEGRKMKDEGRKILRVRELTVYQTAFAAAMEVFKWCESFPPSERYSLADQMIRASRSICANLAEAWRKRKYKAVFINKLTDASQEAAEMQTWLEFALECRYVNQEQFESLNQEYEHIFAMLVSMQRKADKFCFSSLIPRLSSFLFPVFFFLLVTYGYAAEPQMLAKGESIVIRTDYEVGDVAMSNPTVADFIVHESRQQIYLNALNEGYTTLTLWDQKGNEKDAVPIHVYTMTLKGIIEEAGRIFGSIPSVKFSVQDNNVLATGEAPTPRDMIRVRQFAQKYPQIISEVQLAKPAATTVSSTVKEAIQIPGVEVRRVRDHFVLEGVVFSDTQAKRAYEIAKLYDPEVLNLLEVRPSDRNLASTQMVQMDLYFMEIQKTALKTFGIQWAPGSFPQSGPANASMGGGAGGDLGIGGLSKNLVGFVLNLLPKIKFVKEHGTGRVLENPSLFVKSGDKAQFFSGVEVPYYSQMQVSFKQIGIQVMAEPVIAGEHIDLKITATLSSPSANISGGIATNTVSTTAYVPAGQAVVLGGIVRGNDVKTYNRVPKDLDTSTALFSLFLSKDFQKNNSEFVIFVVPQISPEMKADLYQEEWQERSRELLLSGEKKKNEGRKTMAKPHKRKWRT